MPKLVLTLLVVFLLVSCKKDTEPNQGIEPIHFSFSFTDFGGNDLFFKENPTYYFNEIEITRNVDKTGEVLVDSSQIINEVEGERELLIGGDLNNHKSFNWEYYFKFSETDIDTIIIKNLDLDSKNTNASYYFQVEYNGDDLCMPCDRNFHYDIVKK